MRKLIKYFLLTSLTFLLFNPDLIAQVFDDPATMNMSRVEMGNYYRGKAKKQKRNGWILVGGSIVSMVAAGLIFADGTGTDAEEIAGGSLALASTAGIIATWPVFAKGARSTGMADMLLAEPGQNPDKVHINNLVKKYKKEARTNSIIAWSMLIGGVIAFSISNHYEIEVVPLISTVSIFASIPVFANAAENKGRVSVLVRNQSLPVSHMSGSSMYRSIGVSIPITR